MNNLVFVDSSIIDNLTKFQKYNHFPFSSELGTKNRLYQNYYEMKRKFPYDFNYMMVKTMTNMNTYNKLQKKQTSQSKVKFNEIKVVNSNDVYSISVICPS